MNNNVNPTLLSEQEDALKRAELQRMRLVANLLLWSAAVVFVLASLLEKQYSCLGFVSATAGAAMAGAIADWFAVTALFRHPLGLKIPHTAIVPSRKDSVGQSLGRFVKENFLSEQAVAEKLCSMEITKRLASWASQTENSQMLANHAAAGVAAVVTVMEEDAAQGFIELNLERRIRSTQFAPLLGHMISLVDLSNRQRNLLFSAIKLVARLLEDNSEAIKAKIGQETPWWIPRAIDAVIYQKIVDVVETTLQNASTDPDHPLHKEFNALFDRLVKDLKHSSDMLAREQVWKDEVLQHPVIKEISSLLWVDIKKSLLAYGQDPDTDIRNPIQRAIERPAESVLLESVLSSKIDRWLEQVVLYLIREHGHEVESLISTTVSRWDAEATAQKIELQVGKDLQYVRINGTIVGGLVGLVIYLLSLLF